MGALLLVGPLVAFADSPLPPPAPVTKCSPSRSHCATSDPRSSQTAVRSGVSGPVLWATPRYFRFFELSADGSALVALSNSGNLIPQNSTLDTELFYIYRSGRLLRTVRVGDLFSSMSELHRTVSHLAWGDLVPLGTGELATIRLVSGSQVAYSLQTGQRVP